MITQALTTLVPEHLEEVKARTAGADRQGRPGDPVTDAAGDQPLVPPLRGAKLQETAGKQVRLPAQVAKERYELLVARLEKRKAQLALEAQISAKVPILKGGTLVIPVGLLLAAAGR